MITFENGLFSLSNGSFRRCLRVDADGVRTVSLGCGGREFVLRPDVSEFSFSLNEENHTSYAPGVQKLRRESHEVFSAPRGGETLRLWFSLPGRGRIAADYTIYPDLDGCVKSMEFFNDGAEELLLKNVVLEMFNLAPGDLRDLEGYREQGRLPASPCFTITGSDDLMRFHDRRIDAGFFVGSSIPGPLRYVMNYPNWTSGIMCGYSRSSAPFGKYIAPGGSFRTDEIFLLLYQAPFESFRPRNDFRELLRRSLPAFPAAKGVMYCTWIPFLTKINEELVKEVASRASELGISAFVLDDGWFTGENWTVDPVKFPAGLEPVSRFVRDRGMTFGLWFNIGTDYGAIDSRSEDNAVTADFLAKRSGKNHCRCMASKHREFVTGQLIELAEKYQVGYFKLDFSNIISPYGVLPIGCHATSHAHHHNALDSVEESYRSLREIGRRVRERSGAMIDYSFEVFGTEAPGLASLQYGDLHHISNLHPDSDSYSTRAIRGALYEFTALLPPERILGSLITLQDENALENLFTAMIAAPLVAGDLRKLPPAAAEKIGRACRAFGELSQDAPLTDLQLLHGDAPVRFDRCDGYFRSSRDGKNALLAIFANDSGAEKMKFRLDPAAEGRFHLRDLATGELLAGCTSEEFRNGVELSFNELRCRAIAVTLVES